jgi:predicted nucleic acid-binding protein
MRVTMSDAPLVVLDSSVGVKWIKPEPGRETARSLLERHRTGALRIVVASHFLHEVVSVAVRHRDADLGERTWELLRLADLTTIGLDDTAARAALDQCRLLGCSFYEALAPAIADRLGATLYSADARAHGRVPGVELV